VPQWKDKSGNLHTLEITGSIARQINQKLSLDLMQCLVDQAGIETILKRLADSPETLMVACAIAEGVQADDSFFAVWDGDSFESASVALLESIANFIPRRPREILHRLIVKMKAANDAIGDKATAAAMATLEKLDFSSAISQSLIRGNGGSESSASSGSAAKN